MRALRAVAALLVAFAPRVVHAAGDLQIDGAALSLWWGVPFAGILLSLALTPLVAPGFWYRQYGKVSGLWILALLLPFTFVFGAETTWQTVVHTLLAEFFPFIILLFALFTVTGGILLRGNLRGTPGTNLALLGTGTCLASVMGTTGASMLLIRPLLRANDARLHRTHVVVFFIFLVSNIGGSLTPLGDPPLFLGFLKGVDFFWTTTALFLPMAVASGLLLVLFYALDSWLSRQPGEWLPYDPTPDSPLRLDGWINLCVFGPLVLASVLASGIWHPGVTFTLAGTMIELENLMRDIALLSIAGVSYWFTPARIRQANHFEWAPIIEVAKIFAAIFITIIPVIAILRAGPHGALASITALVTGADGQPDNVVYFWLTGVLSSFLDNAPTYLVFFNLAGGDAATLMGPLATTLTAISVGAVFMGANTYIGNAPNFMVRAIAASGGVPMPSFIGYIGWSAAILLPVFLLLTYLFFMPAA
jgi:Na+/H+ antiporter NhaD/arsenite permease-like protein